MSKRSYYQRPILFAGLCLVSLGLCTAGYFGLRESRPVFAQTPGARIVRLLGKARVKSAPAAGQSAKWQPAKIGQTIRNGDLIETGPGSRMIIQLRGTQIRLAARTQTRIDNLLDRSRESRVHLQKGFAWFKVNGKQQPRGFRVSTPTAIASVRGTKFSLAETDQGALSCVCEGVVDMQSQTGDAANTRPRSDAVKTGASYSYGQDGDKLAKDFTDYFRGLKADRSFQSQILKDNRLNYCKTCHRMTNLATDSSPDPVDY
ncbi:MAG: FecR family protein [bacterium]|nr:FecR family protein [bacterium]